MQTGAEHERAIDHQQSSRMNRLFRLGNGSSSSSSRDNSHIHVKPLVFDAVPPLIVLYPHAILPGSQAPKSATVSGRFVLLVDKPDEWVEVVASLTKHYVAQSAVTGQKDRGEFPSQSCKIAAPGVISPGVHE